ncbi:MAG: LysM peptidoglycan-binding domain-containing protein [Candidatus Nomurabacteria bacterium]|jgi:surface antigen|nr:LysM peptidoglycan-binding domain-containing protein [Candidatus Nomurabacteria bacterium]
MSSIFEKMSGKWHSLNRRGQRRAMAVGYSLSLLALLVVLAIFYQSPSGMETGVVLNDGGTKNAYLEQTKEVEVVVDVAAQARLSTANNVAERAISVVTKSELAQNDETVISKPVLSADSTNNSITKYVAVAGDNVAKIATMFGISEQTVKWANNLTGNSVAVGATLVIPVVDGVVYKVKSGDSLKSLAKKYRGSASLIASQNNITGALKAGEVIVIPNGVLPQNERPGYAAPSNNPSYGVNSYFASNYTLNIGTSKAGNNYSYGYCTWYAYNRRVELGKAAYRSLGNANTWDDRSRAAGITVSSKPIAGAIFQTDAGYYGHVGIVESVNPDGTINISDMNGIAGWNRVGFRNNVSPYSYTYIY